MTLLNLNWLSIHLAKHSATFVYVKQTFNMIGLNVSFLFLLLITWVIQSEAFQAMNVGQRVREPSGLKVGDTFYAVSSGRGVINIYSSKNLISWKSEKQYRDNEISGWREEPEGWIYSPEIHQFGGRFNIYYNTNRKNNPVCNTVKENTCTCKSIAIDVATGDSPTGPFKDIGRPLLSMCPEWVLSPHVAHDGMHLYYNNLFRL